MFKLAHDKWCLFSWDGGDLGKVVDCEKHQIKPLKDILDISWPENADIEFPNDKIIIIPKNGNSVKIETIDKKKKVVPLTINGGKHTLKVEKENGKLNIFCTFKTFYAFGHT